ncbi:MAG: type I methionyl aminopeptidase, partial [Bacteroidota bacterium]
MSINTQAELEGIQAAGYVVGLTLKKMREYAKIGMSTKELDEYGYEILRSFGAHPAPQKDYDFPGWTCISINHEVCHGIPKATTIIRDGDLINIDVSAELNGFYGDNGGSFIIGRDYRNLQPLVDASQQILHLAIQRIKSKERISVVGGFIESEARKRGFQVVKNICGHGIGRKLHENPKEIPCFRDRLNRGRFRKNTVIALETFISTQANYVYPMDDGWTLQAKDRSFVAQHEHTLIVTDDVPLILT